MRKGARLIGRRVSPLRAPFPSPIESCDIRYFIHDILSTAFCCRCDLLWRGIDLSKSGQTPMPKGNPHRNIKPPQRRGYGFTGICHDDEIRPFEQRRRHWHHQYIEYKILIVLPSLVCEGQKDKSTDSRCHPSGRVVNRCFLDFGCRSGVSGSSGSGVSGSGGSVAVPSHPASSDQPAVVAATFASSSARRLRN